MERINLNELRNRAYENAIAHGWHEEEHSNDHWLCLIISELMEAVQADRKGKRANIAMFKEYQANIRISISEETQTKRFKEDYEAYIKGSVEEELADACIRIFDFAGLKNIEIDNFTEEEIDDASESCNDETFTETIYAISTLPARYEGLYDFPTTVNDMIMSVFGLAKHLNIDILWHIENKIRYNELRPYKHGNKRY